MTGHRTHSIYTTQKDIIGKEVYRIATDPRLSIPAKVTRGTIAIEQRLSHWDILVENGLLLPVDRDALKEFAFEMLWINGGGGGGSPDPEPTRDPEPSLTDPD